MAAAAPVDLNNIQGDILVGLPKKVEAYWFIRINNDSINNFRTALTELVPMITSCTQAAQDQTDCANHKGSPGLLTLAGVNISFSKDGLVKIGMKETVGLPTDPFETNMRAAANVDFNDQVDGPGATWFDEFKQEIDCLIFITGDCQHTLDTTLAKVKGILGSSVTEVKLAQGIVRPGPESGHEHFGFNDGLSQPTVTGIDNAPLPNGNQDAVPDGVILLGRTSDDQLSSHPAWAFDGSFLAFRYLSQLVPEFQAFLDKKNPTGADPDVLGAQLVGRWKSGTPIVLAPAADIPGLGSDPTRNNNFNYDPTSQALCPFAAHVRKTNPRDDIGLSVAKNRIIRRGIPFGPEVTDSEKANKKTELDRGLLFKCYQSNISKGFRFLQKSWANNPAFPFLSPGVTKPGFNDHGPGFDIIIGQAPNGRPRPIDILNGDDVAGQLSLEQDWVISRGGEYFFAPSIPVLRTVFALAPPAKEL